MGRKEEKPDYGKLRRERQGCVRCGKEDGHKPGCLPKGYKYPRGW